MYRKSKDPMFYYKVITGKGKGKIAIRVNTFIPGIDVIPQGIAVDEDTEFCTQEEFMNNYNDTFIFLNDKINE